MNDVAQLYKGYQKIIKIINSCLEYKSDDPEELEFLDSIYKRSRFKNKFKNTNISMNDLRETCSVWMETVMKQNQVVDNRKVTKDLLIWFFKGRYRERKRFMYMFYSIYTDITDRLNQIDNAELLESEQCVSGFGL